MTTKPIAPHLVVLMLALFTVVVMVVGCDNDGNVLWQRETETEEPTTGASTTVSTGAGGDILVPPPELPICDVDGMEEPTPGEPPMEGPVGCLCPPGEYCVCDEVEPSPEPCVRICDGGGCQLDCFGGMPCESECTEGCQVHCAPGSICTLGCGANCTLVCEEFAECHLWSWDGPSEIYCSQDAICDCGIEENCVCFGPGCP